MKEGQKIEICVLTNEENEGKRQNVNIYDLTFTLIQLYEFTISL